MRDSHVGGALEVWEMSGCVEIRSMDMDDPSMLSDVLKGIDNFMRFFNMKGTDIVRIREILSKDVADIDRDMEKALKENGYRFVNGFYAKGRFNDHTLSEAQLLSYVFRKQHVVQGEKYLTVSSAIEARGYIRTDAELLTRVKDRTSMKKQM